MMTFVEFDGPRGALRGAFHVPQGSGPHPAVVMLHGFGAMRMECNFEFVALSRALEAAGVASLRFDFHGSGESDGDFIDMTIASERADAAAAIDWVKAQPAIDPQRVGLIGMSLGGLVAACTLGARPDVRAGCLWAAAADTAARLREMMSDDDRRSLAERGWVDKEGRRLGKGFFDDLPAHRPYDEIALYGGPVMVIHGTADETVPLGDGRGYVAALEARGDGAVTDHLFIEGGNHPWANVEHRETLYRTTVDWFARNL